MVEERGRRGWERENGEKHGHVYISRTGRVHFRPLEYAWVRKKYRDGPFGLLVTCRLHPVHTSALHPTVVLAVNFLLGLL